MSPDRLLKIYDKHIQRAWVVLPNNYVLEVNALHSQEQVSVDAELVFNTSFNGYGEIITDPSYAGQFVLFTHPHVGSYGVDPTTFQSDKPQCSGILVHQLDTTVDYHQLTETQSLTKWMLQNQKPIVFGIPTRQLVQHIRTQGAMRCRLLIGNSFSREDALNQNLPSTPMTFSENLLSTVSTPNPYTFGDPKTAKYNIAVYDFGLKRGILRRLEERQCWGTVFPWNTPWTEIQKKNFQGLVLSNGPGDPSQFKFPIAQVKHSIGQVPTLAVCLGHQLLCLALEGQAYKLKFGHRGGNHPVYDSEKKTTAIAAHNHGFAIHEDFLTFTPAWKLWFKNLNDNTLSGIKCDHTLSVQFHPEGAPGPHDTFYVFDQFVQRMQT